MKYLFFLPITLLSFGVAFGDSDNVDMATEGGGDCSAVLMEGGACGTTLGESQSTDGTQGEAWTGSSSDGGVGAAVGEPVVPGTSEGGDSDTLGTIKRDGV
jgi:hypothetical protein